MLAVAIDSEEVATRLDKPPRGPHKDEAYLVRDAYFYQRTKLGGQLSFRKFAKEMVGKSTTAVNNWADGKSHMRSDSERKVRALAPPSRAHPPRTSSEVNASPLDPASGRSYDPQETAGGYVAQTDQGRIVARMLDRIEDDEIRSEAMDAAREAIKRFLGAGAGNKTGPSPGKS